MLIKSKKIWSNNQFLPLILDIIDEKIVAVYDYNHFEDVDYDFGDNRVLPGFIDIHTHGAYGFDTNDANEEGLRNWAKNIPSEGVTSFLPTTITQTEEVLLKAVKNVADVYHSEYSGAEILGIHFEGPYLDEEKRGAQPLSCIQKPSISQFKKFQEASSNLIKLITIACEKDENFELTKYLASQGIRVSLGHSAANYDKAALAFANGATSQTHVFNGMTGFHHRDGGQVGFALRANDAYGEIICDGIHSTPNALYSYYTAKGRDHAILITDSLCAKGCGHGKYVFGGENMEIYPDGSAHRDDGRLAGSTLRVVDGLRILIEEALVPVDAAINSCTKNPAEMLGFGDKKGKIKVGFDADITVIDRNYDIIQTFARGKSVYSK